MNSMEILMGIRLNIVIVVGMDVVIWYNGILLAFGMGSSVHQFGWKLGIIILLEQCLIQIHLDSFCKPNSSRILREMGMKYPENPESQKSEIDGNRRTMMAGKQAQL